MDNYISLLFKYWYIVITFLISGYIIGIITRNNLLSFFKDLSQRYSLMKKYWMFIIPYSILAIFGYIWLLFFFQSKHKAIYLDAFGQIFTLIFAIFAGYFAYLQLIESRVNNLKTVASEFIAADEFPRAIEKYEQILKIESDDFTVWSNLMELYLIEKRFEDFDEKAIQIVNQIKSNVDNVKYHYLITTKWIVKEHIGEAKQEIQKLISYITTHPECLKNFGWNFDDIKDTATYSGLNKSTKKIFDNLNKYLLRQLSSTKKISFEGGDYEIDTD